MLGVGPDPVKASAFPTFPIGRSLWCKICVSGLAICATRYSSVLAGVKNSAVHRYVNRWENYFAPVLLAKNSLRRFNREIPPYALAGRNQNFADSFGIRYVQFDGIVPERVCELFDDSSPYFKMYSSPGPSRSLPQLNTSTAAVTG
jgi:hypothetical protein